MTNTVTVDSIILSLVAFALVATGVAMIREPIGTWHFLREFVQGVAGSGTLSAWFWFMSLLFALMCIAH